MNNAFFNPLPRVLAHRGDSACFPENTLPAFESARDLGVDVIETDVHITRDKKVIIWHDDTLERETDGTGTVEEHSMSELLAFDAGCRFSPDGGKSFPFRGKGITMLPFEEALIKLPDMRFNVDLKTDDTALADTFLEIVRRQGAQDRVLCASFHTANLVHIRAAAPEICTSMASREVKRLLLMQKLHLPIRKDQIPGAALQVPVSQGIIRVVTPAFIRRFHELGIYIQVWTINDAVEMRRLLSMGVDGVFTDDPRLLLEVLGSVQGIS